MTRIARAGRAAGTAFCLLTIAAITAPPVTAAPVGFSVAITAHNDFEVDAPTPFESNIPGCGTGTVTDAQPGSRFTPWGGTYVGTKQFACASGTGGFDIKLRARFGGGGSTGTWVVADAWGDYAGLKGSGSLVGISLSETALDDVYTGTVR